MKHVISITVALLLLVSIVCACSGCTNPGDEQRVSQPSPLQNTILGENPLDKTVAFTIRDENGAILLNNDDVSTVAAKHNSINGYFLEITFNSAGSAKFATVTRENINKALHLYADDVLLSSPIIMDELSNGVAVIGGKYDEESLMALFDTLT